MSKKLKKQLSKKLKGSRSKSGRRSRRGLGGRRSSKKLGRRSSKTLGGRRSSKTLGRRSSKTLGGRKRRRSKGRRRSSGRKHTQRLSQAQLQSIRAQSRAMLGLDPSNPKMLPPRSPGTPNKPSFPRPQVFMGKESRGGGFYGGATKQ